MPSEPSATTASRLPQSNDDSVAPTTANGSTSDDRHELRAPDHRQRAVAALERRRDVEREAVEAARRAAPGRCRARSSRCRPTGRLIATTPAKPTHQADGLEARRELPDRPGGHERHEQRRGGVDHRGERRVDPLLRDGEADERDRHPGHAHRGDQRPLRARHGTARGGEGRQRERAERDAPEGHQRRRRSAPARCR